MTPRGIIEQFVHSQRQEDSYDALVSQLLV